jgi:hypothetical protein
MGAGSDAAVGSDMQRTWYLWPPHDLEETSDEFVVRRRALHITVSLRGGVLDLEVDDTAPPSAADEMAALAREYVEGLTCNGLTRALRTRSQYAALPPFAFQNIQMAEAQHRAEHAREQRELVARAVEAARNALLAGDEILTHAYAYLEDARTSHRVAAGRGRVGERVLPNLYKAIETVENALGGQAATEASLGVRAELRFVKRLANQPDRDERHAPQPGDAVDQATPAEVARAIDSAAAVVRAYATRL